MNKPIEIWRWEVKNINRSIIKKISSRNLKTSRKIYWWFSLSLFVWNRVRRKNRQSGQTITTSMPQQGRQLQLLQHEDGQQHCQHQQLNKRLQPVLNESEFFFQLWAAARLKISLKLIDLEFHLFRWASWQVGQGLVAEIGDQGATGCVIAKLTHLLAQLSHLSRKCTIFVLINFQFIVLSCDFKSKKPNITGWTKANWRNSFLCEYLVFQVSDSRLEIFTVFTVGVWYGWTRDCFWPDQRHLYKLTQAIDLLR